MLRKRKGASKKTKPASKVRGAVPEQTSYEIGHTVVSTALPKRQFLRRLNLSRNQKLAAVVVLVAIIGAAGYVLVNRDDSKPTSIGLGCSEQGLRKASAELDPARVEYLKPVFDGVVKTPGYERNPNCMYVVVNYYINIGDPAQASKAFARLEKVYDPKVGYDRNLGKEAKPPADLKPSIDFLNTQAERYKNIDFSTGAPAQ